MHEQCHLQINHINGRSHDGVVSPGYQATNNNPPVFDKIHFCGPPKNNISKDICCGIESCSSTTNDLNPNDITMEYEIENADISDCVNETVVNIHQSVLDDNIETVSKITFQKSVSSSENEAEYNAGSNQVSSDNNSGIETSFNRNRVSAVSALKTGTSISESGFYGNGSGLSSRPNGNLFNKTPVHRHSMPVDI